MAILSTSLFVLLALLLCGAIAQEKIVIQGTGATFSAGVIDAWRNAYSLLRPNTEVVYAPTGSGAGQTAVRRRQVDFGGTDSQPTAADANFYTNIYQIPIVAGQVALLVNYQDSRGNKLGFAPTSAFNFIPLNLSRAAIAGIFAGQINMWNDAAILATNPYMALNASDFNRTINLAIRKENSGTTSIVAGALYGFDPVLYNATGFTYPATANQMFKYPGNVDPPNVSRWTGSTGVSGYVQTTSYSMGYAAINYALLDLVPVAYVENKAGKFVSPYDTDESGVAINSVSIATPYPTYFYANIIDFDGAGVYPFLSFTYMQFQLPFENETFPEANYTRLREMLKVFRWAFTTEATKTQAIQTGFIPLPDAVVDVVLQQFDLLSADGRQVMEIRYAKQHSSRLVEVLLAFTMFFWALSLVAIAYSWWSSSRAKNPLFYALCLGLGVSLANCSAIFFYLIPKADAICELRKWMLASGLTLLLGVMFARGWQLHALKSGPRVISTVKLLIIVSIIFGLQLVLLVVWTAVDAWKSRSKPLNDIDLVFEYECHSDHMIVWLLLELGFFLCLLAWGIYVVYATWRNRAAVDSRWTLIAVYNTLIAVLLIIPLIVVAVDSDDWIFYIAVLAMNFAVLSCVFSIYGSAILRRIWDNVSKSSTSGDSGDGPAKVSSLRMTVGATVNN